MLEREDKITVCKNGKIRNLEDILVDSVIALDLDQGWDVEKGLHHIFVELRHRYQVFFWMFIDECT